MIMSRDPSAGTRKRSLRLDPHLHLLSTAVLHHEMRRGAGQQFAVGVAADHGDREMRFIAHGRGARGDGIHAAGDRTQRRDQRLRRPLAPGNWPSTSDTWQLAVSLAMAGALPSSSEMSTFACLATCTSSGRAMRVSSRSSRSHSSNVCVLPSWVDGGGGIELGRLEHGVDRRLGIAMHDAERVAGLVEIAEPGERELDVAHFAQRAAADDALVGQHFGRGGIGARELGRGGRRRGSAEARGGHVAGRRVLVLVLAHARERVVGPGLRELLEVHVAIDARQQALGAEFGEALVDHAAGFAELRIAGVAEREHRVLQLGQLRRALGAQEFVKRRALHPADRRRHVC